MTREQFQPATGPQPARGVVDPVHGARLVRARALGDGRRRDPDAAGRRLRRAEHPRAAVAFPTRRRAGSKRPPAYVNLNSHWWDASQIYGSDAATVAQAADEDRRQAAHGTDRAAAGRSGDRRPLHRVHRQLVDRAGDAPQPVHAGAQLSLRSARSPAPRLERRSALPDRQADQLGADGQDPHRRMDARDRAASRDSAGVERQLVGPGGRGSAGGAHVPRRQGTARRHRRLERRPPHRAVLADRGVRLGLPHAPAHPGRLRVPLAGHRTDCSKHGNCRRSPGGARRRSPSASRCRISSTRSASPIPAR